MIYVGTAGWSIPLDTASAFPGAGTHLERYARVFRGAEINSTFYREHMASTYTRWADSVPEYFRFSVKIPKEITHEQKLFDVSALLEIFLLQATCLGDKLGCLLVQLPPSLAFNEARSQQFFTEVRQQFAGPVAFEPRHPTWFTPDATQMLVNFRVSRVGADPAPVPLAAMPGAFPDFVYLRLHGSPRIYYSAYGNSALQQAAATMLDAQQLGADVWCVFDNTASGAAAADALRLQSLMPSTTPATALR